MPPPAHDPLAAAAWVKDACRALGFDGVGIARAGPAPHASHVREAVEGGRMDPMPYLKDRLEERLDPTRLLPGAQSVVVVMMGYAQERPTPPKDPFLKVARYAARRDYHNPFIKKLRRLRKSLRERFPGADAYVSSDTGAVLERAWAQQAGLGWIGKSGMLLNTRLGSYTLLGTMITTVALAVDEPGMDHCGTCTACLTGCPTGAIVAPQVVDARKCITAHTVENPGEVIEPGAPPTHGWVFGCDVCQEVCPWSHRGVLNPALPGRPELAFLRVEDLTTRGGAQLPTLDGSPLARAKVKGLVRNAKHASGS